MLGSGLFRSGTNGSFISIVSFNCPSHYGFPAVSSGVFSLDGSNRYSCISGAVSDAGLSISFSEGVPRELPRSRVAELARRANRASIRGTIRSISANVSVMANTKSSGPVGAASSRSAVIRNSFPGLTLWQIHRISSIASGSIEIVSVYAAFQSRGLVMGAKASKREETRATYVKLRRQLRSIVLFPLTTYMPVCCWFDASLCLDPLF